MSGVGPLSDTVPPDGQFLIRSGAAAGKSARCRRRTTERVSARSVRRSAALVTDATAFEPPDQHLETPQAVAKCTRD